jgi:hypothetical protein
VPSGFLPPPNNCPTFINSFLDDPDFKQCYPLSMLIEVSITPEPRTRP